MASIRRTAPEPTPAQVRDYILTMLEGLSTLAETADDLPTRDRLRDFAEHLLLSWSSSAGGPPAGVTIHE